MSTQPLSPEKPSWLSAFLSHCHTKSYDKQIDLIRQGQPAETLYYLLEGSVAVLMYDADERRELLLTYLNKGEFIGEMGLFIPQSTRSVIVRTRTPCRVAEITYRRLDWLLEHELAEVAKALLYTIGAQLALRLQRTSRKLGDLAFVDVSGRIAGALLDLCEQPDAQPHPQGKQIRITRQELGHLVGCSREMAGRVLKGLEEQGLVRVRGKTILVYGVR
ncbi:cAMP-activated global transcriptional regulator CRP [Caldichromatium japonicum]|uniref:cAMP-activated global transcriptional regulator CRP n=1 Tax=Caldichromatium japonicum TaxID=2699430 RepID=A0A6G7VB70_9GAMM|nr:cAMP-activated global transcriptional regulator CRP [Caldichromatium japonicum]QIK37037.1 cAMP-activated global transcriptional regulator CRP [Caldichromatium japonicum]